MRKFNLKMALINIAITLINISLIIAFAKPLAIIFGISLIVILLIMASLKHSYNSLCARFY